MQRLIKFGADQKSSAGGMEDIISHCEKLSEDSPQHMECAKFMKNWRLIRRELKHVEVRSRGQTFLNDPSISPQRTQTHDAIAFDMAASDLSLLVRLLSELVDSVCMMGPMQGDSTGVVGLQQIL